MEFLKYNDVSVVLQEVPNEISLSFTMIGCQLGCKGCHSAYLWDINNGEILSDTTFIYYLEKYKFTISCVLFMGGEWAYEDLLKKIDIAKEYEFKTALYTGLNHKQVKRSYPNLLKKLDYIKTGKWLPECGGLNNPDTNQKMVNLKTHEVMNHYFHK